MTSQYRNSNKYIKQNKYAIVKTMSKKMWQMTTPCSVCAVNKVIFNKLIGSLWHCKDIVSTISVSYCNGADPQGSMSYHLVLP